MQETNWKTWAVIVAILIGGIFEMFKRLPENRTSAWDVENLRINNTAEPFSIRGLLLPRSRKKPQAARVAALDQVKREQLEAFLKKTGPAEQTTFDHLNKAAEGADAKDKKKKKDDEEWEEVVDPKTGKKVRRKKKKQAKKDEEKKEQPIVKKEPLLPKQEEALDEAIDEAIASGGLTPPIPAQEREDDLVNNLEDWVRRLLSRPDLAETRRFIAKYNDHLVSAEIFYKITEMMIEDSRPEMKRLGVMCAGLTPSVLSFQMLSHVTQHERSDSKVRVDAEAFLMRYTDMMNIGIIENILRSPTPSYSTVIAAQKLEAAAQRYLTRDKASTPKPPTQNHLNSNISYFRRYVSILQGLSNSNDASVKDQAGRTLSRLLALLNNNGTPRPPAPDAPTQTS